MINSTPLSTRQSGAGQDWLKRILTVLGIFLLTMLATILVLGLLPLSSQGMQAEPDPAGTYEEAMTLFQQVEQAEQGIVNDLGHSRLLTHGNKAPAVYVMVHGTTNSPEQWQELGETLYNRGHNVVILRMPYHGLESHRVNELKRLTAPELRAYADQAIDIAAGLGDEIVVVGISGGGAATSWIAQNRPEVDRALLLAPFFGIYGVPEFAGTLLMNAFSRLPNVVLDDPLEPRRDWVYRGEATRGVAAFLAVGHDVKRGARDGDIPDGQVIVLTTARDNTANNRVTAGIVALWRQAGADVVTYEFEPSLDIPHNSVDPAADTAKKQMVYDQILELLGESVQMTEVAQTISKPEYVTALEASYGAPSQAGFGSAVFYESLPPMDDLEQQAVEKYKYFVGDLWERFGEDAWMGSWREVYARSSDAKLDIVDELRAISDPDARYSVPTVLDVVEGAEQARNALSNAFDDPAVTELRVFNLGDGEAMSGLLVAGRRVGTGGTIFLVFLLD